MQYNRLNNPNALLDLIKALDKRISGVETRGTGPIGFVGADGVELHIGVQPDGQAAIIPFVGDTTPPPVATSPDASAGPGFLTVTWDGLFVNGETMPLDFEHLNVVGSKIVNGVSVLDVAVGIIRNPMDSCLVGTEVAAVGETWEFVFVSEDYNGNLSTVSAKSDRVTQKSFAADVLIDDALSGLQQDFISAQSAAASAQTAANNAQAAANQNAQDITKKGTIYTQIARPAADKNGLWIDKGHNNVPRRYLGYGKALVANVGGGASVASRLTALGASVSAVTAMPTVDDAAQYDIVAFDAGYAGLSSPYGTLASQLLDRGVSIFTSGNDTTNLSPLFTGGTLRGTTKNPIRPVGTHPAATGWSSYNDSDLNYYLTGVRSDATVTGVTLVASLGTDQPLNIVWEHPTTFARWVHVETYATPAAALDAHLNWMADNWVAVQDQAVVTSIAAAQLKADQAFNNAATAATAAGNAQTTADSKNRSWYQPDQPAGTGHKVGDNWFDTDDGYKLRTWNGTVWQTTQDSALAQMTADSKGRTYTQDTVPPVDARLPQNLWIDTSAGPGLYVTKYWNGTAWTALKDKDADAAQQTADSKGETIYSDTEPAVSKRLPQNTWVDTTGGVNITKRWINNAWTPVVDARIPSTAAAVTAVDSRVSTVSATAESKGIVYTQPTVPPVSARLPQNVWNDTSLGLDKVVTKYWNGSAWTALSDKAATDAQTVADSKGEIIYSPSAPAASKQLPQNLWVDTTGGINITKRWDTTSGTWVVSADSRIASTAAAVTAVDSRVTAVSSAVNVVSQNVQDVQTFAATNGVTLTQNTVPSAAFQNSTTIWNDTSLGLNNVVQKYWNGTIWTALSDKASTDAQATANSKGETIYSSTAPDSSKQLPQNTWVDTTGGINIVKRWDGFGWVVAADSRIASTANAVTAVDARVTGVSSAAGTAIGNVDTKVTSVSAAASGQINTVDSRVSGVSAAASSGIATVDSKVTSVSAAASSAVSSVDSRVTAVSAVAASKGEVIYSSTTPDVSKQLPQNQWVDTTGGINIVKRWNTATGTWVVASDQRIDTTAAAVTAVDTRVTAVSSTANTQITNVDTRVTGVSAAAGTAIVNVDTKVTSVSAAASGQISSVDSRVTGVSAAAGTAITNVDTRVTGVSSAAGSAITNVDTRVTGVSAAASSGISTVDTRVTGVSAAAGTAIGNVDTRVTGVSAAASGQITTVDTRVTGVSAAAAAGIADATTAAGYAAKATSYSLNPSFDDWTGVVPTSYNNWTSNPVKDTTNHRIGAYGLQFVAALASDNRGISFGPAIAHAPNLEYFTVEVEFMLLSGTSLQGAGILLDWGGLTPSRSVWKFADSVTGTPVLNKWYRLSKVIRRNTSSTGTWTSMGGYLMANYSEVGTLTAKTMTFDWLNVRPSTAEEILSYTAPTPQDITNLDTRVTGVSAAANTQITNVDTRVTGVSASATTQIGNVDTRVTGVSAAATTQIGTVDTRVTGVSAAASGQITSVDTRVTGVSAAAGTAITNVDTKVTGVSAAANTQIGSVDSRVTGVSAAAGTAITTVDTRVTGVSSAASSGIATIDSKVSSVSASVTSVDTRVTGVSAAAGSAISTVDARVTGVSSAAGTAIGTVDTRVTGVSAAASTAITNVDTRVTGVSAAASGQINTVDTRVTGVSAAAGTAITNVDTKVTGVSAAASGQIGSVDARVTGVSAAAGTAIGNVDTRVTGVSAAASAEATAKANAALAEALASSKTYLNDANNATNLQYMQGATLSVVASDTAMGGVALQKSGSTNAWFHDNNAKQAYDPTVLYRLSARVRVSASATTGGKGFYFGFVGLAADGTTYVNASGANSYSSQQWAINNAQVPTDGNWVDYVCYYSGLSATTPTGAGTSPSTARKMHALTRMVVPGFIIDYPNGNGTWELSHWSVDVVDATGYQALLDAASAQGTANSKTKTYYQPASPALTGNTVGDIWFDTGNGNKPYVWNGSIWSNAQDLDILKSLSGTHSSDWDVNQPNKWAFTKYIKTTPANTSPTYGDIAGLTGVTTLVSDATNIVSNQGDNYIGQIRTIVNNVSSKTIAITATHDDGARVYVNGVSVYSAPVFTSNAAISFTVPAGWSVIDILWAEQAGGDGITAVSPLISSQVTNMYAPVSLTDAASTATTALTAANGKNKIIWSTSDATGTTGYTAGDVWFKRDGSNNIIAQWEFTTSWQSRKIDDAYIANVNAAKLTAGTIAAARIAANTISADKIIVGDMTNLAADGNFQDGNKLNWIGSGTVTVSAGQANMLKIVTAASGNNDQGNRNLFQVTGGEQLYGEMWAYGEPTNVGGGGPNLHVAVSMLDGSTQWPTFQSISRASVSGQWVKLSGSVTIPANAKTARVEPAISFSADAVGNTYYIRDIVVRRKATGSLIVDGAIQAGSAIIGNGAIGNAQIADLAVNTAEIADAAITNAKIKDLAVDNAKIANLAVNTAKIQDLAVDNAKIADLAVDNAKIKDINATKITAGTIDAQRLNADDIRTKLLAANKINAIDIIASGSISSSTGLFGNIDASSINSGTISAARIGAGSISASALSVTLGGNNLVPNSSFEVDSNNDGLADGWFTWARGNGDAGRVFTNTLVTGMFPGSTFAQRVTTTTVTNTEQSSLQNSQYTYLNPGDKVVLSLYARANSLQNFSVSLRCEDNAGGYKGDANFIAPFDTVTQRFFSVVTIPAGTTRAKVTITSPNSPAAGSWFEIDGVKAEVGDVLSAWSPMTSELLPGTINATMLTATAIDGKTITGSTIQTTATASRGIKLTPTELAGYDNAGVKNFSLTSSGSLALMGALTTGSTITGSTVTGSTVQTEVTANRGIKLTTTELAGYNTSGVKNFSLLTDGTLSITGAINSGSTITGATVTGGTVQSESTANRGIKLTSAELAGYDTAGVKNFSLSSAGALAIRGDIMSGSTITGATLSAAGGGIVTNSAASRGVKLQDTGITAYDSLGNLTFKVDAATGLVEAPGIKAGSITSAALAATAIDGKTITGATITGSTIQTTSTASRGIKLTSTELAGYDNSGNKNLSLATDGTLTLKGAIQSGSTISGATLTGTGIETTSTASRGVKIASTGITTYDASGNMTFKVDATTGLVEAPGLKANSISSTMLSATAIDGMVITGPTIQTTSTGSRGIKLTSTEFAGYDNTGVKNFSLLSDGTLTIKGAITSGSTITGATVTGGTVQSEATASRGIKMTSTELAGYDLVGNKNFSLTSAGALTLIGQIKSGSTIEAATLSAGGGGIQTSPTALRGVKITDTGIKAYDGSGNLTFQVDGTTGVIDAPGLRANSISSTMIAATAIDGKTITGATVQTEQTASRGIKLTSSELAGYDGAGNKNFSLASNGTLTLIGAIKSGSTIEGAQLTGTAGIQTSLSATAGVKINNSGIKAYDGANNLTFSVDAATGLVKAPGLEVNSITGDKIASGAITTKHLTVGDFTNLATIDELNGTTITSFGQTQIVGGYNKLVTDSGSWFMFTEKKGPVPFKLGDKLRYEFVAKATAATTATFSVYTYDAADANSVSVATVNIGTSDTPISGVLEITNSNMATAQKFVIGLGSVANKGIQVKNVRVIRQADTTTIADGAIKTQHVTLGTLDGGVISAGTVTSTQIKSKSITADDLVISSTDNLIVEADFGNGGASWGSGTNPIIMPTAGRASLPALRWVGSVAAVTSYNLANKIAVEDTNRYRASFWVRSDGALAAGKVTLNLKCYISGGTTNIVAASNDTLAVNTWTLVTAMVPALPAGTYAIEAFLSVQNDTTGRLTDIDYVSLTRAMDGKLVVDGSITAASIAASAVNASHISAKAITASALDVSSLWADNAWLGTAGASSLKLSTSNVAVSSVAVSGAVSAIYWDKVSSEVNANGIRVYNTTTDVNGGFVKEDPLIQLGTFSDDYFQINSGSDGNLINMDSGGTVTAKTIEAEEINYRGDTLARYIDSKSTRGMVAWGQVQITTSMACAGGQEIGLFELAWDAQDADDTTLNDQLNLSRMYQFNVNDFIINTGGAGIYGLRLRMTTDNTTPTINSPIVGFKYFRTDAAGLTGSGSFTRIIGSNNGAKIRLLLTLYSSGSNANVYTGAGQTYLYSTITDLGTSMPPAAVASTGGGTPYNGAPVVPPPTNPKVTRTIEYGYYGSRSFLPSNQPYNYNVTKAYQGLSPAGYGNLNSIYTFNQNFQTILAGAAINDIWVYLYFEHWYNNAGGTARIRLHNNLTTPSTYVGVNASVGIDSGSWPKGAGRWVRLPSSTYAGFQSGSLWKGFALVGDGTYNTYGIANNARIRIRYTV